MQILTPVPATHLEAAARLWWSHFGSRWVRPRGFDPENAVIALKADRLRAVMGLRDHRGGFVTHSVGALPIYRAAPETDDLVIDGIAADKQRGGLGRALIGEGLAEARRRHRPGLRAEVVASNAPARAFYSAMGFEEIGRGRFGWWWTGQVLILRRPV